LVKDLEKYSETMPLIWLVNFNAMPPELESRLRTIKFAEYLLKAGYKVKIFASSVMHNMNVDLIENGSRYIERSYNGLDFVHIKTIKYKDRGWRRIYSLIEFHIKLCRISRNFEKPDVIIGGCANPFGNFFVFCAKRLKARYFVEVLDLWPESFVKFGLLSSRNPLVKFAYLTEKWLYTKADKLIFSMEGGPDYIRKKKWDKESGGSVDMRKVHYINNGVDLSDFDSFRESNRIDDPDLNDDSKFRIVYIGSIRLANNLIRLCDAAALLKENRKLLFLIYGDGDERESLENYCNQNNMSNVKFKEKWIDPKFVPYLLSQSSLNILNYMQNDIWQYGGSQSKLFQYLASGKPICSNLKMGYCLINKFNLGIAREFSSDKEYADAISSIAELDEESYNEICLRSRKVSEEFDYKKLTQKLIDIL
jgi:glycosyltransferase involved in cell wall biosynthesis